MLWIAGHKGLLGSALSKCKAALHCVGSGHEVDIASATDIRSFIERHPEITHIVNCAAFSLVDPAETRRDEAFRANVLGPENLALIAREKGIRLTHISTDYVFSGTGRVPLKEEDLTGPCNYYGETKLEGEQRALACGASIIRISGLFGDGGKNFVSKMLEMLQSMKEIRLTDDQWGRFTYAPDLSETILQMLDTPGLYHYANSGVSSKYEFGLAMREEALALGYRVVTESIVPVPGSFFPSLCKRPQYSAFDTTKIEKYVIIRHWREALREFLCAQLPVYL